MSIRKTAGPPAILPPEPASALEAVLTPVFASEAQAAAYLCETEHQLYLRRRRGDGPRFITFGSRIRYPIDELVEWAKNRPRFKSRAEAYVADPERAVSALRQRAATARARESRWRRRPRSPKKRPVAIPGAPGATAKSKREK